MALKPQGDAIMILAMTRLFANFFFSFVLAAVFGSAAEVDWQREVERQVNLLGHRNMIVVADSAYPVQTAAGVEVIATGADHREVVAHTLKTIAACPAVRPLIALDKEFAFVSEEYAPGAKKLRDSLLGLLKGKSARPIRQELHATLLGEVNTLAADYTVVVFKTTGTIPYSSVFFTLDCGYWSEEAEKALRDRMSTAK